MTIYQNEHCYFFRKPAHIASTYGKSYGYMDKIFDDMDLYTQQDIPPYIQKTFEDLGIYETTDTAQEIITKLKTIYTRDQEYGLVNRLDTLTAGFLYMVKSPNIYSRRKSLQQQGRIHKHYIAGVDIFTQPGKKNAISREIATPLAHHKNGKKMLACTQDLMNSRRKQKIKGKSLDAHTNIVSYQAHPGHPHESYRKLAHICIQKGRRHQIRCHLASEGEPIIGDQIYHPDYRESDGDLQLWSVGCEVRL